jgi:hypothetical protein
LEDPQFDITITDLGGPDNIVNADMTIRYVDSLNTFQTPVILQFALIEDMVPVDNVNARTFQNVVRKLLMNTDGRQILQQWAYNLSHTETIDRTIDFPIRNKSNLYYVAWVQDKVTKRILQSLVVKAPDKVGVRPVGLEDDPIAEEIRNISIYPNPASNVLKLELDHPVARDYTWRLIDQRGISILDGEVNRSFDSPQEIDISQVANGIYFIQIVSGNTPIIYRKIAVMNRN